MFRILNVNTHIKMPDVAMFKTKLISHEFTVIVFFSSWHVLLDCICDVYPYCMHVYEPGVAVFVYVCIWFTHQNSCPWPARGGMPFRLLQKFNVTQSEVSGKGANSGSVWRPSARMLTLRQGTIATPVGAEDIRWSPRSAALFAQRCGYTF